MKISLEPYSLSEFEHVAAALGQDRCRYVVTPNADHIIRLHEDANFRSIYKDADFVLFDSRFLALFLRIFRAKRVPVCPGSDLTEQLFAKVIKPDDAVVLIGGTNQQVDQLRERFQLTRLHHYNPPMGFVKRPEEIERCIQFIESVGAFRFCFMAVGAPQQEILANALRDRGIARGLVLCIGASINFLTGHELRAPTWMRSIGMEWLFRCMSDPKRLAHRYFVRGPRVFRILLSSEIVIRNRPEASVA